MKEIIIWQDTKWSLVRTQHLHLIFLSYNKFLDAIVLVYFINHLFFVCTENTRMDSMNICEQITLTFVRLIKKNALHTNVYQIASTSSNLL